MTDKPSPQPTPLTEPYWAATAEGKLSLQRCTACATWTHFPVPRCTSCGSDALTFEPVCGQGTVETFTIVHRSFVPGFTNAPYAMAWIALPEQPGLRVFANITDCALEDIAIGMKVTVWFEQRGDFALPNFHPA
jgi:uncharacterized OB-fold protein